VFTVHITDIYPASALSLALSILYKAAYDLTIYASLWAS